MVGIVMKKTIEPFFALLIILSAMFSAVALSFQSRESTLDTKVMFQQGIVHFALMWYN